MPAYFAQMSSADVWGRDGVAVVEVLTLFWTSSGASGAGGGGELHYLNERLAVQTCPAASDPRVGWDALKLLGGGLPRPSLRLLGLATGRVMG